MTVRLHTDDLTKLHVEPSEGKPFMISLMSRGKAIVPLASTPSIKAKALEPDELHFYIDHLPPNATLPPELDEARRARLSGAPIVLPTKKSAASVTEKGSVYTLGKKGVINVKETSIAGKPMLVGNVLTQNRLGMSNTVWVADPGQKRVFTLNLRRQFVTTLRKSPGASFLISTIGEDGKIKDQRILKLSELNKDSPDYELFNVWQERTKHLRGLEEEIPD